MSLTREEWSRAASQMLVGGGSRWDSFDMQSSPDGPVLVLRQRLIQQKPNEGVEDEEDGAEMDEEALTVAENVNSDDCLHVRYAVKHSTSYQVPVLRLAVFDGRKRKLMQFEELYSLLVSETSVKQLAAGSPLGMLTMVEDENHGGLEYQVHPCRTQEMMQYLLDSQERSPLRYLMLWLGAMGPSVGLKMPREVQLMHQSSLMAEIEAQERS